MIGASRRASCKQPENEPCTAKAMGRCYRCSPMSEAERECRAAAARAKWQHPEFRERNVAATRAMWRNLEFRGRQATAVRAAQTIWPDCPPDKAADYETLRHYMTAREARATLDPGFGA